MDQAEAPGTGSETSTVATLQSLIVAFVLAMTFRGFVTEGFVIPTGSMAPTLMGEHLLLHSDQTGSTYPVDAKGYKRASVLYDPMLGAGYPMPAAEVRSLRRTRMGDRILVLKSLYPFAEPNRFDVVVFKNPTDPDGDAENYIKRLIGLPNEAIWLVDGDVFVGAAEEPENHEAYEIQRKPEHIQRSVWQPVHDSDFMPVSLDRLAKRYAAPWSGEHWQTRDRRIFECDTADETTLVWDNEQIALTDWTSYNMFSLIRTGRAYEDRNTSDLRVSADIVADQAGLNVTLDLETRDHVFQFAIADGRAVMRIRPRDEPENWIAEESTEVAMPQAGKVYSVEFWHADQTMMIFINGRRAGDPLEYDWSPVQRVENAFSVPLEVWMRATPSIQPTAATLRWTFAGSPLSLHRVRVDRDLYYRADTLTSQANKNPTLPDHTQIVRAQTAAYGTHPSKPAVLGPDHFFMLGDNSPASSDSRLWGNAHPYVTDQIDDHPFLVHRKLLLGKAWVVYFPALYPLSENGRGVVPDFGRLRFIR
ncbi:MAG: S26 family signal peptidase [Planctomycetota bacterium]|jgi:signal peptidase I